MIIYSWNILFSNKKLDEAFAFVRDSKWDIFCLQEVPEHFLAQLRTLPVHIASVAEAERTDKKTRFTLFVVILSRYPIQRLKPIPLSEMVGGHHAPIRTALFDFVLSIAGMFSRRIGDRQLLYADVTTPQGPCRIFNLHLSLLYPEARAVEFETAMIELDSSLPTVVCGDFNILESPHITPINFLRGGRASDVLFYSRERTYIEKRFFEHELINPLRGSSTHPISQSQLDHILVSKSFSIKDAEVIKDRRGSDHCPIRVEVT